MSNNNRNQVAQPFLTMADVLDGDNWTSLQCLTLVLDLQKKVSRLDSKLSRLEAASAQFEESLQSQLEGCQHAIARAERKLAAVEASGSGVVERINILSTEQRLHLLVHKDQDSLNMLRCKKLHDRVKLLEQTFSLNEMD